MNEITYTPESLLPNVINQNIKYFSLFSYLSQQRQGVGYIAPALRADIRKAGLILSVRVWDFATIALSVSAADLSCQRATSADGWTREFKLNIHLCEPGPWIGQRTKIESVLRFLTGDFWSLNFLAGGEAPPKAKKPKSYAADCVSLISGGLDSLVGGIDITARKRNPLFVAQIVRGDRNVQEEYANALGAKDRFCQWSFTVPKTEDSEGSTRARSIVFYAFAALAASAMSSSAKQPVEIFVPENGFISLNVPLNAGRMGSLSTKTTHPIYVQGIQSIWDAVGINAKLVSPYRFKTKGELLAECADQNMLTHLAGRSTSCGKFGRYGLKHCGRCVPCLVRRAAFLKAGISDSTVKGYVFDNLANSGHEKGANDIKAVAAAYLQCQTQGVRRFVGGALAFATADQRSQYEGVVERGLNELGQLLTHYGVI